MTTNKPEVVAFIDVHSGHGRRYVSLKRGVDHYSLTDGDPLIRLSDYETLQADRDQQYDMKVKTREQRDAVTAKLNALQAECEKLRKLATECADYLDTNDMTSIAHGSVLHRKLIDAAMQGGIHE